MNRLVVVLVVCVVVGMPALADPTIRLSRESGYYSGQGGEFTATPLSGWSYDVTQLYDTTKMVDADSFQTFCIEYNEHVSLPGTYDVTLNDGAVAGGLGGAVNGKDLISVGTAYLYYNFAKGTLADYNYAPGVGRGVSAGDLQNTFWWLEHEFTSKPNNAFTTLLDTMFTDDDTMRQDNAGQYAVGVMNLTQNGERKQDQLVLVPVPAAFLLGLLGFGAAGLKLRRCV